LFRRSTRFWLAECSVTKLSDGDACASGTATPAAAMAHAISVANLEVWCEGVICVSLLDDRRLRSSDLDCARGWLRPGSGVVTDR
jgi:hypothetical protein